MKSSTNLVVVLVVVNLLQVALGGKELLVFKDVCVAELNLNAAQYANFMLSSIPSPTHDDKCLVKCLLEKGGMVNAAGEPQADVIRNKMPATASIDLAKCVAIRTDDSCETVYQMQKCVMEQLPGM